MDLGKINRDAEDRGVVRAAGVTALPGASALLWAGMRGVFARAARPYPSAPRAPGAA